jgi:hypothetical protein
MYHHGMASAIRDDLSTTHLAWLVQSRAANQKAALELFKLFERYPEKMKSKALSRKSQSFVAACFSLWRAAFLADKTGLRSAVFEDAKAFLGKMLVDNAITYPQDRNAREWTFNYYMTTATEALLRLSEEWSQIDKALNEPWTSIKKTIITSSSTAPQRRWDRTQYALSVAIACLQKHLKHLKHLP